VPNAFDFSEAGLASGASEPNPTINEFNEPVDENLATEDISITHLDTIIE
jgi:hypothetical protein